MMASRLGVKTVDIGAPQFGMHSISETCGVLDSFYYLKLFEEFLKSYETLKHDWFDNWY